MFRSDHLLLPGRVGEHPLQRDAEQRHGQLDRGGERHLQRSLRQQPRRDQRALLCQPLSQLQTGRVIREVMGIPNDVFRIRIQLRLLKVSDPDQDPTSFIAYL